MTVRDTSTSPATRAVQAQLRTAAPARPRAGLFGSAPELAELTAAWKAAADGAGQVVVLTGEAGIGKTSLLAELAHRVRASGGRMAIGAGIDVGGETPFAAWLELARALVATVPPVPAGASWPAELSRLSSGGPSRRPPWPHPSLSDYAYSSQCCGWSSGRARIAPC